MPKLREHPPTRDELSTAYGFTVPEAFARLMAAIHRWAIAIADTKARKGRGPDPYHVLHDLTDLVDWVPAGPVLDVLVVGKADRRERGCGTTPPEYMRFGDMCVDGAAYGYVVHAPELNAAEYAVAGFCPMDSDGVYTVGEDTLDAVRRMMSDAWRLREDDEQPDPKPFEQFAALVGVEWSPDSKQRGLTRKHVRPTLVPKNWLWVKSADGVGVLAPRDAFRDGGRGLVPRTESDPHPEPIEERRAAERDLADGYAGSALHRLRELWWAECGVGPGLKDAAPMMAAAYERLGRPLLARLALERGDHEAKAVEEKAEQEQRAMERLQRARAKRGLA